MSVFDNMSDEEIDVAQNKLNKLCKKYKIRDFSISAKKAPWKQLVLSMCDIHENKALQKRGAKPRQQEQIDDFLQSMMCFKDFGSIYDHLPQPTMEDAYKDFLKNQNQHSNKPFKSTKSLENIFYKQYQGFLKRRQKDFEKSSPSDEELTG